jgi:hypothetical protein
MAKDELHPDLVEIARTPQLFDLVIRLKDRLNEVRKLPFTVYSGNMVATH